MIVQECGARLYGPSEAKRGGSGTRRQASPDPRTTTNLNQTSRVVE
jgi:hypothetical protein